MNTSRSDRPDYPCGRTPWVLVIGAEPLEHSGRGALRPPTACAVQLRLTGFHRLSASARASQGISLRPEGGQGCTPAPRVEPLPRVLRPEGAQGCSHGWSPRFAGATRGTVRPALFRPGGAAESFHLARSFLRPAGAGSFITPAPTGCAAGLRPCAPPVAIPRGPVGAECRVDARATASAERTIAA